MSSQLLVLLCERLEIEGIPPYTDEIDLPDNYHPDIANQFGRFTRESEEGLRTFVFETTDGTLCIREVPADWPETQLLHALDLAEEVAWDTLLE